MSMFKRILCLAALGALPMGLFAEPQRTLFSVENAFPRWEQFEVGTTVSRTDYTSDFDDSSSVTSGVYVRYGALENLALQVALPHERIDPPFAESESGLGDIAVGLQLRTFEDIFGYPFIIPHVTATLPTGDDEKGLGAGDPVYTFGLSYGDKVYDFLTWILDLGYRVNPETDNQVLLSNSILWHLSPAFSFLTELRFEDNSEDSGDSLVLLTGGMSYNWSKKFQMGVHAGSAITGDVDTHAEFRLSYSF